MPISKKRVQNRNHVTITEFGNASVQLTLYLGHNSLKGKKKSKICIEIVCLCYKIAIGRLLLNFFFFLNNGLKNRSGYNLNQFDQFHKSIYEDVVVVVVVILLDTRF